MDAGRAARGTMTNRHHVSHPWRFCLWFGMVQGHVLSSAVLQHSVLGESIVTSVFFFLPALFGCVLSFYLGKVIIL